MGIGEPVLQRTGQAFGLVARVVFPMHLIAAREQPIDVMQTASARIHAHNGPAALAFIQLQGPFCRQQQRRPRTGQLRLAIKEAIDHDFPVVACQHAAQLATAAVALFGKVARCRAKAALGPQGRPLISTSRI